MTKILCIETSEKLCSVALSIDGVCKDELHEIGDQNHARFLTILIDKLLKNNDLNFYDLDAISVCAGPGSYTGLRIGVSTAKGICWASNLPLISLTSSEILASMARGKYPDFDIFVTALDARRNEVFMAVFDESKEIKSTEAVVLDTNPMEAYSQSKVLYCGTGAAKFSPFVTDNQLIDNSLEVNASEMTFLSNQKFIKGEFENVAYFEPKYFKAVHTSVSTKKIFE